MSRGIFFHGQMAEEFLLQAVLRERWLCLGFVGRFQVEVTLPIGSPKGGWAVSSTPPTLVVARSNLK